MPETRIDLLLEVDVPTVTRTKPLTASLGTVTVSEVALAVDAATPRVLLAVPKTTVLSPAVVLNPPPLMVSVDVPGTMPAAGVTFER